MKNQLNILVLLFVFSFFPWNASSQSTIGLLQADSNNVDGYVLFSPIAYTRTYLIDKCGRKVNEWPATYRPGLSVYLLENGNLLRTGNLLNPFFNAGGGAGYVELVSWTGQKLWSYTISDSVRLQHHDVYPMPNGNILIMYFEKKTLTEALDAGLDSIFTGTEYYTEKIVEIQPLGIDSANIVWEWSAWDHLVQQHNPAKSNYGVVSTHPELIHINYNTTSTNTNPDWIHLNAIVYNPTLDQIMLCSRSFSEFWIIDHSTNTALAAGHSGGMYGKGGDLLYRWGNPRTYNRGVVADQKLYGPHSAHWIPDNLKDGGAVMVFNNGNGRPAGNYSTVEIIYPAQDSVGFYTSDSVNAFGPTLASWTYTAPVPNTFFSLNISGAQRLPNGNTLICEGASGTFFEIDSLGTEVWNYKNPVNGNGPVNQGNNIFQNQVFRCTFYSPSYPAFQLQPLVAGAPIELNPIPSPCTMNTGIENISSTDLLLYPNPSTGQINLTGENISQTSVVSIYSIDGKLIYRIAIESGTQKITLDTILPNGIYCLIYSDEKQHQSIKFIVQQ